jgi:GDP-L-fucose synthase
MMRAYSHDAPLNVGFGKDIAIADLARMIAGVVGFDGAIACDPSKPDGTPRKLLDSRRLCALGWRPRIGLAEGLAATYAWYLRGAAR